MSLQSHAKIKPVDEAVGLLAMPDNTTDAGPTIATSVPNEPLCVACSKRPIREDLHIFCELCFADIESGKKPPSLITSHPESYTFTVWADGYRKFTFNLHALLEYLQRNLVEDGKANGPDRLKCFVCKEFLMAPMECFPCRHTFCDFCVRQLAQAERNENGFQENFCPVCGQIIHYATPNTVLESETDQLEQRSQTSAGQSTTKRQRAEPPCHYLLPGSAILRTLLHKYYERRPKWSLIDMITYAPGRARTTREAHVFVAFEIFSALFLLLMVAGCMIRWACRGSGDTVPVFTSEISFQNFRTNETGNLTIYFPEFPSFRQPPAVPSWEIKRHFEVFLVLIATLTLDSAVAFCCRAKQLMLSRCEWFTTRIIGCAAIICLAICELSLLRLFWPALLTERKQPPFILQRCLLGSVCWGTVMTLGVPIIVWCRRHYFRACARKFIRLYRRRYRRCKNETLDKHANA